MNDLQQALSDTVPLSKLSAQVEAMRKWAKGRARTATSPVKESTSRKITREQDAELTKRPEFGK